MAIEVGNIVEGTVVSIAEYGAFVRLPGGKTGLVHISQISDKFVKEVKEHIKLGTRVIVKIISIDKGKIQLTMKGIKQPEADAAGESQQSAQTSSEETGTVSKRNSYTHSYTRYSTGRQRSSHSHSRYERHDSDDVNGESFERKLRNFLRQSEDRLIDLKKSIDAKQGIKKKKVKS